MVFLLDRRLAKRPSFINLRNARQTFSITTYSSRQFAENASQNILGL